jgi:diguanylate cyclase (GGDEF)-like protein
VIPPIQQNTFAQIDGKTYVVTATLVQPDFGKYMPKTARAPITITALPIDAPLLKSFAERYLLDGLVLAEAGGNVGRGGQMELRGPDRRPVAALVWIPRQPGTMLLQSLWFPLLCVMTMLCLAGWTIMRRSDSIVTNLVASEAQAKHLAFHDPLTRLPNRAMLFERLRAMLVAIGDSGHPVSVLCVDLDRFKDINDTLGHHAGDLVIETMAVRLRQVCNGVALIARLGGDEFVVLSDAVDGAPPRQLGEFIIAEISKPVQCEYGLLEVGCSIGAAVIERPGVEPTEALRWADLALYRSKELGRGRFTVFEPEMDFALRNRRSLEADLRNALTEGGLRMVYQPQVDVHDRIIAVEALLRWQHPTRGDIPPGVFVPLAEETGLILPLGEFVLRQVFTETADWPKTRVAINVSAEQMRASGFAALVARIAAQAGIDPARYEIELTETALLGQEVVTEANINALKRLGFTIALDDFGTGYSSLSVLQRFSVDKIKIDRSFVSCLEDAGESEALVDAMVKLARALDLRVIAEGVETGAQRTRLAACGCTEFQGFLTGRPMSLEAVEGLLGSGGSAAQKVKRAG